MHKLNDKRLLSLDLFRGITMLLLLAEGTHLFYFINGVAPQDTLMSKFAAQFLHTEWHGMHFWDLIQPYFTFIVGISMALSLKKRWERGETWITTLNHILYRCAFLFFLGIALQCGYNGKLVWELWNILTQLSISILITFLIFRFSNVTQLIISFGLLLVTEMLYRYTFINGFDQPFVKDHNFGTFVDLVLMGKTNHDGWVAFNTIPTTAHIVWGVMTGKVLLNETSVTKKIKIFGFSCLLGLLIGYGLDWTGISPINKKICTSSFVIASGAWSLASLLFLYWLTDIRGYRRGITFATVVGMNPIFIYFFSRTVGRTFLTDFVTIFTKGLTDWVGLSESMMFVSTYIIVLGLEWYICYWFYKKRIFIKI